MPLIEWQDRYSVGIEAVDHEHREMIDLINTVHAELLAGTGGHTIASFLGDVLKGISAHFALEERFMREHGYDQLAEHKSEHERLLDALRDIMDSFESDPEGASRLLSRQLDDWFTVHFATHDARLHHRLGAHDGHG
ncbi:bacteriohemerythrin [Faunimonas sp. B44]|uniref:bacteriohemerythrin n=1 Tax=Faunimonas sp. B44 TaxID=3461493 RepID=UPI00404490F7